MQAGRPARPLRGCPRPLGSRAGPARKPSERKPTREAATSRLGPRTARFRGLTCGRPAGLLRTSSGRAGRPDRHGLRPSRGDTGSSLAPVAGRAKKTRDPPEEPEARNVAQAQREARWGRDACRGNGPIRGRHGRALQEGPLREPAWGARQDRPMRKPACGGVAGRANERAGVEARL